MLDDLAEVEDALIEARKLLAEKNAEIAGQKKWIEVYRETLDTRYKEVDSLQGRVEGLEEKLGKAETTIHNTLCGELFCHHAHREIMFEKPTDPRSVSDTVIKPCEWCGKLNRHKSDEFGCDQEKSDVQTRKGKCADPLCMGLPECTKHTRMLLKTEPISDTVQLAKGIDADIEKLDAHKASCSMRYERGPCSCGLEKTEPEVL